MRRARLVMHRQQEELDSLRARTDDNPLIAASILRTRPTMNQVIKKMEGIENEGRSFIIRRFTKQPQAFLDFNNKDNRTKALLVTATLLDNNLEDQYGLEEFVRDDDNTTAGDLIEQWRNTHFIREISPVCPFRQDQLQEAMDGDLNMDRFCTDLHIVLHNRQHCFYLYDKYMSAITCKRQKMDGLPPIVFNGKSFDQFDHNPKHIESTAWNKHQFCEPGDLQRSRRTRKN